MSNFRKNIAPYVEAEISKSKDKEKSGCYDDSFAHLENAHVLGQESTYWHVKVHYLMFLWGIRHKDVKEVFGQFIRIIGAAALTSIKGVPIGNTGGSNVSPVKPMPIKPEHAEIIAKVKSNA
ncbi:DUF3703 domain-containing protein [Marinomonas transparens]|uniref:DUF3703 domain-containing protein n=1 Tax=Marinomonas transparens TaxID=2795388 RepID=UPI002D7F5AF0|nr:DUF3703 domain-containing protein [Marinomonas transparens]